MRIVLTTVEDMESARKISTTLLQERLAACISILPIRSMYWWEDRIEESDELLLIVKTAEERVDELIDRLASIHPYEVPEIAVVPVERAGESYLRWLRDVTLR